ncbi:hypothetical protein ACIQV3_23550 [Streptomyces sp. NPDC099050]|uniref:hypothetical protein n=1 Tax=Streptomyces sp. NPDC099050 TaxID=3366100 RepID=UPI0038309C9C
MSVMRMVVCLPGAARDGLREAIGEVMAPFEQCRGAHWRFDNWDSWAIRGGTDREGFRVLPGRADDPRLVAEDPLSDGTVRSAEPGWCAGGPREALDLAAIRTDAGELAGAAWDAWHRLAPSHPPFTPFLQPSGAPWPDLDAYRAGRRAHAAAWEAFAAQPLLAAHEDAVLDLMATRRGYSTDGLLGTLPYGAPALCTREEYVARRTSGACLVRNVLTLDGWWCEAGDDPVHAGCEPPPDCPHPRPFPQAPVARNAADRYLEALPGDTLLVWLRVHY